MKLRSSPSGASRLASRLAGLALGAATAVGALASASCAPDTMPFKEDEVRVFAGGLQVDGHKLNLGYESYMRYCYACHGEKGDGKGPSSYGLRPPPRDFTKGLFKFARLRSSDELPHDSDLVRIVKGGLHGTAMLQWDIPDEELDNVIQFIKTFAPQKWEKKKKSGEPVKTLEPFAAEPDPWGGKEAEAIQTGKELYHLRAECLNCHPSYLGKQDLYELSQAAAKKDPDKFKAITGFRADPHGPVAKDSAEYGVKILPPDFTFHRVRSATSANPTEDLYRILSFGVYPIMPAWKGAGLSDSDIWAIAHYVKSLIDMKGTAEADQMKAKFAAQEKFEIPAPPPPPADAAPADAAPAEGEKKDEKKDEKAPTEKKKSQ
jgi:mono/diheme cytochrome c family protein